MGRKKDESPDRMPEEVFIAEAIKSGRAIKARIALDLIGKPDTVFQARAGANAMDANHAARLEWMLGQLEPDGDLHPIVVFRVRGTDRYLLADGIHRTAAYRNAKREKILACLIEGDEQDALEYCTMCNRLATKPRDRDDMQKAVEMLLENETWWNRSDHAIAKHVGYAGTSTVAVIRHRMADRLGRRIPAYVESSRGTRYRKRKPFSFNAEDYNIQCSVHRHKKDSPGTVRFIARVNKCGVRHFVTAATEGACREKLVVLLEQLEGEAGHRSDQLGPAKINHLLKVCGFAPLLAGGGGNIKYPGIGGWHRQADPAAVVAICNFSKKLDLPQAVGQATWMAGALEVASGQLLACSRLSAASSARKIILCYAEDGPFWLIDLYRKSGFEFMSPEELRAEFKPLDNSREWLQPNG